MHDTNKLPVLKHRFRLMLGQLTASDQVAIITYAGSAGQVLAPTAGDQTAAILAALEQLQTGGSNHRQAGLQLAYRTATQMAQAQDITRVILAKDRDFNLGISDPEDLKALISTHQDNGIYLTVLGFCRGKLDNATLQALDRTAMGGPPMSTVCPRRRRSWLINWTVRSFQLRMM